MLFLVTNKSPVPGDKQIHQELNLEDLQQIPRKYVVQDRDTQIYSDIHHTEDFPIVCRGTSSISPFIDPTGKTYALSWDNSISNEGFWPLVCPSVLEYPMWLRWPFPGSTRQQQQFMLIIPELSSYGNNSLMRKTEITCLIRKDLPSSYMVQFTHALCSPS